MKERAGFVFAAFAIVSTTAALSGCADGVLGNTPSDTLPRDVHYKATAAEVKADPCKHDDLTGCIARCQGEDPHACNMVGVMFEFNAAGNDDPALASGFY